MIVRITVEADYVIPDHVYDTDTMEEESSIVMGIRAHMMDTGGSNFSYTVEEDVDKRM